MIVDTVMVAVGGSLQRRILQMLAKRQSTLPLHTPEAMQILGQERYINRRQLMILCQKDTVLGAPMSVRYLSASQDY